MGSAVEGDVALEYRWAAEAFEATHQEADSSAHWCVVVDGRRVIDLWCGRPSDAIQCVFSATKGATAACANLLVQRGLLELDSPVARYWPEYAVNGKEDTLVRWVLSHRAGVLAPEDRLSRDEVNDPRAVSAALAAAAPAWRPGAAYGYHAQSFGWLVGELIRRVDGRALAQFFAEEVAAPASADFWIGLPESADHRLIDVTVEPTASEDSGGPAGRDVDLSQYVGPHQDVAFTLNGALPTDAFAVPADPRLRRAEIGASNGYTDARGLALTYAWMLGEFTDETLHELAHTETSGPDQVLTSPAMTIEQRFCRGFETTERGDIAAEVSTFGHNGAGGTTAFADPLHGVAFGYVTSKAVLGPPGLDPRARALVDALYRRAG